TVHERDTPHPTPLTLCHICHLLRSSRIRDVEKRLQQSTKSSGKPAATPELELYGGGGLMPDRRPPGAADDEPPWMDSRRVRHETTPTAQIGIQGAAFQLLFTDN
ncbi:MAG: hypothetical protein Q8N34_09230, partial [Gammaproteobacteria bacterium]|nr:hypothetical protein [Gammaproteobacteria bacterium]